MDVGIFVEMKILQCEKRLCTCCMEEHEVKTALVSESITFKGVKVEYEAIYRYCDLAEELHMDEQQMQENDVRINEAYREAEVY